MLEVKAISNGDVISLFHLIQGDATIYSQYFDGLPKDEEKIRLLIAAARKDRYWSLFIDQSLAGFFMLRGLDQGFAIPAFGVYIRQKYANVGLAQLALSYAISWCKLSKLPAIMLSVNDMHFVAKKIYEKAGFKFEGKKTNKGNLIYTKYLNPDE